MNNLNIVHQSVLVMDNYIIPINQIKKIGIEKFYKDDEIPYLVILLFYNSSDIDAKPIATVNLEYNKYIQLTFPLIKAMAKAQK